MFTGRTVNLDPIITWYSHPCHCQLGHFRPSANKEIYATLKNKYIAMQRSLNKTDVA